MTEPTFSRADRNHFTRMRAVSMDQIDHMKAMIVDLEKILQDEKPTGLLKQQCDNGIASARKSIAAHSKLIESYNECIADSR